MTVPAGPPAGGSGSWSAHRDTALRLVRYSSVSVVATTTSLVTLGLLVGLVGTPATTANVIATAVGTVPSFELNRRWVWGARARRSVLGQVVPFCALSATGLVVSTLAVGGAAARTAGWSHWSHTVAVLAANVAAYGSLWVAQYVLADRVLFRSATTTRPVRSGPDAGVAVDPIAVALDGAGGRDGRLQDVGALSGRSAPVGRRPQGRG